MKRQWGWNRNSYMYSRAETAQPLWFWVCHTIRETNRTSRNDIPISQLFTKKVCFRDRQQALPWDSWFAGCEINLLVMQQDQTVNPCSSVILAGQIRVTPIGGDLAGWVMWPVSHLRTHMCFPFVAEGRARISFAARVPTLLPSSTCYGHLTSADYEHTKPSFHSWPALGEFPPFSVPCLTSFPQQRCPSSVNREGDD